MGPSAFTNINCMYLTWWVKQLGEHLLRQGRVTAQPGFDSLGLA